MIQTSTQPIIKTLSLLSILLSSTNIYHAAKFPPLEKAKQDQSYSNSKNLLPKHETKTVHQNDSNQDQSIRKYIESFFRVSNDTNNIIPFSKALQENKIIEKGSNDTLKQDENSINNNSSSLIASTDSEPILSKSGIETKINYLSNQVAKQELDHNILRNKIEKMKSELSSLKKNQTSKNHKIEKELKNKKNLVYEKDLKNAIQILVALQNQENHKRSKLLEEYRKVFSKNIQRNREIAMEYTDMKIAKNEEELDTHKRVAAHIYGSILDTIVHGKGSISLKKELKNIKLAGIDRIKKLEDENKKLKKEMRIFKKKLETVMQEVVSLKNRQEINTSNSNNHQGLATSSKQNQPWENKPQKNKQKGGMQVGFLL